MKRLLIAFCLLLLTPPVGGGNNPDSFKSTECHAEAVTFLKQHFTELYVFPDHLLVHSRSHSVQVECRRRNVFLCGITGSVDPDCILFLKEVLTDQLGYALFREWDEGDCRELVGL